MFLYVIRTYISIQVVTLRCRQFCKLLTQNAINLGMGYLLCDVCVKLASEFNFTKKTGMLQIIFLCVTNKYIFLFIVTLLLLIMFLSLVQVNTSSNITFTTIIICHQISTGPTNLFFLFKSTATTSFVIETSYLKMSVCDIPINMRYIMVTKTSYLTHTYIQTYIHIYIHSLTHTYTYRRTST